MTAGGHDAHALGPTEPRLRQSRAEGIDIHCVFCGERWVGYTRDYCPGCGLDELGRPAPKGGRRPECDA